MELGKFIEKPSHT